MRPIVYTVTATDQANGYTPPLPVDYLRGNGQNGIKYYSSGGVAGTGTVQYTIDDVFNLPFASLTWAAVPMTNGFANLFQVVRAFNVLNPVAGDVITIVAQGAVSGA